jgi:hypothetical protein
LHIQLSWIGTRFMNAIACHILWLRLPVDGRRTLCYYYKAKTARTLDHAMRCTLVDWCMIGDKRDNNDDDVQNVDRHRDGRSDVCVQCATFIGEEYCCSCLCLSDYWETKNLWPVSAKLHMCSGTRSIGRCSMLHMC